MAAQSQAGLRFIAIFKLLEAALLVLLAVGAFRLLHKDVGDVLEHWIKVIRIDPDNRFLAGALAKAGLLDDRKLETLGALTLIYAALFLTEGIGLFLRKRWAEYLTVVATASFVPLEIYEIYKHASAVKVALLILNLAILAYLVVMLRRKSAA